MMQTQTATLTIESTKGTVTVGTVEEAAAWLTEYQPSHASINGEPVDWSPDDNDDAMLAAVLAAVSETEEAQS